MDLRNFKSAFPEFLVANENTPALFDASLPTLILAECVLVYLDQTQSDALIEWFSDTFTVIGAIVFEMFGLDDSFGRVMKENLKVKHDTQLGLSFNYDVAAVAQRVTTRG